jgi:hypothetical protein
MSQKPKTKLDTFYLFGLFFTQKNTKLLKNIPFLESDCRYIHNYMFGAMGEVGEGVYDLNIYSCIFFVSPYGF